MSVPGNAYFITPSGDILNSGISHIDLILKQPNKFLVAKEDLVELYQRYLEPVGCEGKAREEILVSLFKQNWIRVRHIPKTDSFTIQINQLDKRKKDQLYNFAIQMLQGFEGVKYHPNTDVRVLDLNAELLGSWTLDQLSKDILFNIS